MRRLAAPAAAAAALACAVGVIASTAVAAGAPNILFILTDDQDVMLGSSGRDVIPKIHSLLGDSGVVMSNTFATTPVCCPSRSSFVTSKHLHNIPMQNNTIPGNCSSPAFQQGAETRSFAVHMSNAGYRTGFFGKYLNTYGFPAAGGVAHVPPGWTEWAGLVGNSRYYDYTLSINGKAETHGNVYAEDYLPSVLYNYSTSFISSAVHAAQEDGKPFLAVVSTPSCHDDTVPAPQYANSWMGRKAPRTPNYASHSEDKNWFVRRNGGEMPLDRQNDADWQYMRRLDTLRSVDDIVEGFVNTLNTLNVLEDTYIFYTADHGFHQGQFGLMKDKRLPYEFDIRIPGFVRGPGLPQNATTDTVVTMIDFGPTFLDIAGVAKPADMDGISVLSHLQAADATDGREDITRLDVAAVTAEEASPWPPAAPSDVTGPMAGASRTFLIEFFGEHGKSPGPVCTGTDRHQWTEGEECYIEGPEMATYAPKFTGPTTCSCQDSTNNTYACARTINATDDTTYCEWLEGFGGAWTEYYDNAADVWQRTNGAPALKPDQQGPLHDMLYELRHCSGDDCHIAWGH